MGGPYHGKLDRLFFDGTGQVSIVHVGGSHVQADMWSMELRHRFQSAAPGVRAGMGFIFPFNLAKSKNPWWYVPEATGRWTGLRNVVRTDSSALGMAGISVTTRDTAATLKVSFRGDIYPGYTNEDQAKLALKEFGRKWDDRYKRIRPKWEENWVELMAFMDFGEHIRHMIYTTNPVEGLHRIMRKVTKSKGAWTSDRALIKQLFLALKHSEKSWKKQAFNWKAIQEDLIEKFGEPFSK